MSYVYTPMRYIWDQQSQYFPPTGVCSRYGLPFVLHDLRLWDTVSASRVDRTEFFRPGDATGDSYLMVAALVAYKGVDLATPAFNALKRLLKIIGSGPLATKLRAVAHAHIEFLGWCSNAELRQHYAACRAVIFPALEDFGLVPLEANAAGRPAIALAQGSALETILPANQARVPEAVHSDAGTLYAPTGVLFAPRTVAALQAAVRFFEAHESLFQAEVLRRHAQQFDRTLFKQRL
ncbi:hypothetical protein NKDENANG_00672 [Candidatus Entotheonellaceae bacterium PAL068K]